MASDGTNIDLSDAPAQPGSRSGSPATEMAKAYDPKTHEPAAAGRWSEARAFHADPGPVLAGDRKPYCMVIPPPNVTAKLHLGHALNNTIQDVLARRHRMLGYETLWMPGADHAGIATQTVVEKKLLETEGKRRTDYEREAFVAKVQAWKDEYEKAIRDQLLAMGCSCDWDRWRFTMDPVCARAVREAFFRLFTGGLIYRGKRLVNWDPVTRTALADDEVEMKEVDGHFYYLKYPLTEPVKMPDGSTWEHVTVATTRPETYLGDTAVAVHPDDPRAEALVGRKVRLPMVGREIPIIADEYVVMPAADPEASGVDVKAKFATGFLKVTPAHDPNDYEIGRRHDLAMINVMAPDGSISDRHGWEDTGEAQRFVGMSREDARKAIVEAFDGEGLLEKVLDHRHSVGHSYRSHAPIEPYLSDQWYVAVTDDRLRGSALRAMTTAQRTTEAFPARVGVEGDDTVRFFPGRYAKTFEQWHEGLRDWCISRQLWWGHRIPVWSREFDDAPSALAVVNEELERFAGMDHASIRVFDLESGAEIELTGEDTDSFCGPAVCHVCLLEDEDAAIAELEGHGFRRDPDVLDTWFSSALWPLSTMGWPEQTDVLRAFNPTDVLSTARDIMTLWVSRMVMFNRYFAGDDEPTLEPGDGRVPFRHVFIHAMIQDGEGRKMSKSLGNGVDPMDIIHSHGADAMRYTLCQMTTQTQDVRLPVERDAETGRNTSPKFDLGKRFCNKLWNASRFTMLMLREADPNAEAPEPAFVDRWMLSRLARTKKQIDEALDNYHFNVYADAVYDLLWRDFCDWYLEAIKPTVRSNRTQQAILRSTLDAVLRMLHPACPFVTEAIHEHLAAAPETGAPGGVTLEPSALLCSAAWPAVDESLASDQTEEAFDELRSLVEAIRDVRASQSISHKTALTLHCDADLAKRVQRGDGLVETMANLASVTTDQPAGASATLPFAGRELRLSGMGEATGADAGAERERLSKQIGELDKQIATLEKRLSNPGYVQKAPANLVQETRDQLASLQDQRAAASKALDELA